MDWAVAARQSRLADRFGIGWMRVTGQGQIFGRSPEFHGNANLVDQLTRRRADNMRAQNPVGFLVYQDFHKPLASEIGLGPGIAHEVELAGLEITPGLFQCLFRFAHAGHFGRGIDHAGNDAIVYMAMLARHLRGHGHAFVFGLMRQHRPVDGVADGIDLAVAGPELRVDLDEPSVDLNAGVFQTEFVEKTGSSKMYVEVEPHNMGEEHVINFLDCMRSRAKPNCDADFAYKIMTAIKLGVDSYREGKMMLWDPKREQRIDSAPARKIYEGDGQNHEEPRRGRRG